MLRAVGDNLGRVDDSIQRRTSRVAAIQERMTNGTSTPEDRRLLQDEFTRNGLEITSRGFLHEALKTGIGFLKKCNYLGGG